MNTTNSSSLWTQLIPTCEILQINVNSSRFLHIYTRKVLPPHSKHYHQHPIYFPLCNHTWSHFGLWQSQVNTLSPIWYLHQNNADPSRFLHKYTRKVHLPHSKHYYKHPICFPLCNTDLQVRMISITYALVRLSLGTSYHAKHRSPTTPQIDALTRRRHPRLPLHIHEMSWQRVSRHVRATRKSFNNTINEGGNREYTKCHTSSAIHIRFEWFVRPIQLSKSSSLCTKHIMTSKSSSIRQKHDMTSKSLSWRQKHVLSNVSSWRQQVCYDVKKFV